MTRRVCTCVIIAAVASCIGRGLLAQTALVFRAKVDRVTLSAVVRDRRGQLVKNLSAADFELLDTGERRPIVEFRAEKVPASLGVLLDVSGSMAVGDKLGRARLAVHQISSWLEPGKDETALFAFDTELRELRSFSTNVRLPENSFDGAVPFGATSLWDGIATAARRVLQQGRQRRALVVLTDGIDTRSRLSASEVSSIASAVEVPVYIILTASVLDEENRRQLADLARSTGGDLHVVSGAATASIAARRIVDELRHQYLLALETSARPGWHPLAVRTQDGDLRIHARSGYFVEP